MKLLLLVLFIPLVYLYAVNGEELDIRIHLLAGAVCFGILAADVIDRKRKGESWNQALAQGEKLISGNIWIDAGILFLVLLVVCIVPFGVLYLLFYP